MAFLKSLGGILEPVSRDVRDVTAAAGILRAPEFEIFHLAFARWHGRKASDAQLEPLFVNYLFREQAPPWVRHFTRAVIDDERQGRLDPTKFGLPARPAPAVRSMNFDLVSQLILAAAWVAVLLFAFLDVV